jgi:hypothetical protein
MRIVLSRKGFDSAAGGVASPIFPSGALWSLPIPELTASNHATRYGAIRYDGQSLGEIITQLTNERIGPASLVHLDPDLRRESLPRQPSWQPLFGQAAAAESHLQGQGVGPGDVFLFFGWFRRIEQRGERYHYVKDAPDQHVIFGWLQIEQRLPVSDRAAIPAWAMYHPHCQGMPYSATDSLYIATDRLTLGGRAWDRPGAGVFRCYDARLCLTTPEAKRSLWRLPGWFDPRRGRPALTYHGDVNRWSAAEDHVHLDSAKRGQEFVLDCDEYPEAIDWLADLLSIANVEAS